MTDILEVLKKQKRTLKVDFYIIGANSRKSNQRRIIGNRSIKSLAAMEYGGLFNKQFDKLRFDIITPLVRSDYFWVFDLWYANPKSDVSIELMFDLMEKKGLVVNDNKIRNYMCLGEVLDKEFPRTRVRVFGD